MKVLISIVFFALSTVSYAGCSNFNCSSVKITRMYVTLDGNTVIGTSGDESNLDCDAGSYGYISIDNTKSNYDSVYSLLLMAHATQSPINVRTTTSGSCSVVYLTSDK